MRTSALRPHRATVLDDVIERAKCSHCGQTVTLLRRARSPHDLFWFHPLPVLRACGSRYVDPTTTYSVQVTSDNPDNRFGLQWLAIDAASPEHAAQLAFRETLVAGANRARVYPEGAANCMAELLHESVQEGGTDA